MFSELFVHFKGDWLLSIFAYNCGTGYVDRAIREEKTRDAFELVRRWRENDRGYLAEMMAIVLILKNPQVLN